MTKILLFDGPTVSAMVVYALVAALVYIYLPKRMQIISNRPTKSQNILLLACLLFFVSLFLPSPPIQGQNTNFSTHFFGGGIFTGLVWLFLKRNLSWKPSIKLEIISLYFLVSGLGVANELFEFVANGLKIINIPSWDTWWDLFANTVGATFFYLVYRAGKKYRSKNS